MKGVTIFVHLTCELFIHALVLASVSTEGGGNVSSQNGRSRVVLFAMAERGIQTGAKWNVLT